MPSPGGWAAVPFSVFPSTYRNAETSETTEVQTEEQVTVQGAGREEDDNSSTTSSTSSRSSRGRRSRTKRRDEEVDVSESRRTTRRGPRTTVSKKEDVHIYEDDRSRQAPTLRPETRVEFERDQRYREPYQRYTAAQIDVEDRVYDRQYPTRHTPATQIDLDSRVDIAEQQFRERTTPFAADYRPVPNWQDKSTEPRQFRGAAGYAEREPVQFTEDKVNVRETRTVDAQPTQRKHKIDMGYYDEDGHYHSFRHGLHKAADRILHPIHGPHHHHTTVEKEEDVIVEDKEVTVSAPRYAADNVVIKQRNMSIPNTITIPCHHIRIGDLLILQGRPCQVIRITTSAQTGQHRYLGVDLFSKQLHEESSFVSNPSPSVIVQNMLGPVFKQYRVLDIREDGRVVAMTETGDVKQGLPVLDQSSLLRRLTDSFNNGRGSVRVLVINDEGSELAVDYKIVHGSRL
ncbi:hypothetical protein K431DRAFT_316583 [Polychaeton citri CBS 116435]|uniref:Translation initiation factor 5A C-terminal domain-containing protein n=1 Tax=Polychaeton citri CBS 116435 TaxID=1314669 RepID=A0A9P4PYZ8_9PEZI|nr:hypothetical protein K431DRAFT_316583 [Polychaeton citri CBS 116435]